MQNNIYKKIETRVKKFLFLLNQPTTGIFEISLQKWNYRRGFPISKNENKSKNKNKNNITERYHDKVVWKKKVYIRHNEEWMINNDNERKLVFMKQPL